MDPQQPAIDKALAALTANGFKPLFIKTKEEALSKIKELIPAGASVMSGASETLHEIGFKNYLKNGAHPWNNLQAPIVTEQDPATQHQLRRQAVISDFYLGSVHALSETGELIIASNTGSQLPHLVFTSPNIVLVVGLNKLVATLADGFTRLKEHVLPLEDERLKKEYGIPTTWAKTLILHQENPMFGRTVHVLIVNESLGF